MLVKFTKSFRTVVPGSNHEMVLRNVTLDVPEAMALKAIRLGAAVKVEPAPVARAAAPAAAPAAPTPKTDA